MASGRIPVIVWAGLLMAGVALSFGRGQLPVREAALAVPTADGTAPDLALYADVIREVKAGRGYYEVAREKIPQYGFPIASPLNWRLPTYAWALSRLPNKCWIQAVLLLMAVGAMWLTFGASRTLAERDGWAGARHEASLSHPTLMAGVTTFLMFGVVKWTFDGLAYLAQEPWAAVLIMISLAAGAMAGKATGDRKQGTRGRGQNWRWLSIAVGVLALLFRELALPYCVVAGAMAAWKRRWLEAAAWAIGIAMFLALFAWHVGQVKAQLAGSEVAASGAGLAQWLRFGGLDFVLLTTRMNSLLFAAPAWLLWFYVLVALIGLSRGRNETSRVACGAALLYLLAFAVVGRPENFYWGLLPAPLLVWGVADGLRELGALLGEPAVAPDVTVAIERAAGRAV